jgi:16S rRNA (adenine1518-N6/adenine1519-N6)-dimethyltransferase
MQVREWIHCVTRLQSPRISPRKSLGQNFLRDENIAGKIIAAIRPERQDVLLEIGPGEGALTRHLAAYGAALIVIDVDARVVDAMHALFPQENVEVLHGDFLKTDLPALAAAHGARLRIVGNIPYNITSPILFHVLDNRQAVVDLTIMVQKEVARRIVAGPGSAEYGILSVMCGYCAEPALLFDVSPNAFFPRPKVVSSVVRLRMQSGPAIPARDEAFFRAMVRSVFGKRRKTLRNSLAYFAAEAGVELPPLAGMQRRPEELSIAELVELSNTLPHDRNHREKGRVRK